MYSWLLCKETRRKAKKYHRHRWKKLSSPVILAPGIITEQVVTVQCVEKLYRKEKKGWEQRKRCLVTFENVIDNMGIEHKIRGILIKNYILPLWNCLGISENYPKNVVWTLVAFFLLRLCKLWREVDFYLNFKNIYQKTSSSRYNFIICSLCFQYVSHIIVFDQISVR